MATTLGFDVYGTLIDTHGVVVALQRYLGDDARAFSQLWRDKQLEYSFRRGLMSAYDSFAVCTANALDYACAAFRLSLSRSQKDELLALYRELPVFADVPEGLGNARRAGLRLYAFSNGKADAVNGLLENAGIRDCFLDVISVDEIASFKPDPAVYQLFLRRSGAEAESAWLVSSNPFDVIGAISAGMQAAWVQRSADMLFDPWGTEPTMTVNSLTALSDHICAFPTAS